MMSAAGWFIVGLAVLLANFPFLNQRVFGLLALALGTRRQTQAHWLAIA